MPKLERRRNRMTVHVKLRQPYPTISLPARLVAERNMAGTLDPRTTKAREYAARRLGPLPFELTLIAFSGRHELFIPKELAMSDQISTFCLMKPLGLSAVPNISSPSSAIPVPSVFQQESPRSRNGLNSLPGPEPSWEFNFPITLIGVWIEVNDPMLPLNFTIGIKTKSNATTAIVCAVSRSRRFCSSSSCSIVRTVAVIRAKTNVPIATHDVSVESSRFDESSRPACVMLCISFQVRPRPLCSRASEKKFEASCQPTSSYAAHTEAIWSRAAATHSGLFAYAGSSSVIWRPPATRECRRYTSYRVNMLCKLSTGSPMA